MSERQKDYLALAIAVSPFVALALALVAIVGNLEMLVAGTIAYAVAASFGCLRLLADIWAHGVHNDR